MDSIIEAVLNYGLAGIVCGYFMFTNYKFNEKLVDTLARIDERLEKREAEENENKSAGNKSNKRV